MAHNTSRDDTSALRILSGIFCVLSLGIMLFLGGCVTATPTPEEQAAKFIAEQTKNAIDHKSGKKVEAESSLAGQLPARYQKPSYMLSSSSESVRVGLSDQMTIPVGAKITPTGPKPLRVVMQELAKLKSMNISWASDVDRDAAVNVTIMPAEDFFEAIDNLLRQLDYFYEMRGSTIVIKHKETKRFHIAMPFMSTSYSTEVGGDVLGSTEGSNMKGNLSMASVGNKFDIWENIQGNLDKILEIWSAPVQKTPVADSTASDAAGSETTPATPAASTPSPDSGKGYYTIDRPIGLITVTAPRSLLVKVSNYLDNLKAELYRQITIEAKIVEVTLSNDNSTGINWDTLLNGSLTNMGQFNFNLDFQKMSSLSSYGQYFTINNRSFTLILDAMKQQGHVEVLSNPKISVMNGQPAMISVGESVKYVDSVNTTVDSTTGTVTYSIITDSIMSGLGLGVVAIIGDDNQIILSLTPVTSKLTEPIEYKSFGSGQVGLPKVSLREMNTVVRVKDGEMLIVGGLIDNVSSYANNHVSGLGKVPVLGKLFRSGGTSSLKKELVILLRPHIISM